MLIHLPSHKGYRTVFIACAIFCIATLSASTQALSANQRAPVACYVFARVYNAAGSFRYFLLAISGVFYRPSCNYCRHSDAASAFASYVEVQYPGLEPTVVSCEEFGSRVGADNWLNGRIMQERQWTPSVDRLVVNRTGWTP